MPHFFLGKLLFFGSRSQSSGDCIQDVSLCNQLDLGASWPVSPRSFASLSLRLPLSASVCPLGLNSVCLRCRHSASGALTPGALSQLGRPHALQAPVSPLSQDSGGFVWSQAGSSRLCPPLSTPLYQLPSANLPLPQAPSSTACAKARTRRFSSSRGSAASARSSAIRE